MKLCLQIFSSVLLLCLHGARGKEQPVFRWASSLGDHMVLQRAPKQAIVWGFGEIGQKVNVSVAAQNLTTLVYPGIFLSELNCLENWL